MKKGKKKKSASIFVSLLLICLSLSPLAVLELYLRAQDYGYVDRLFLLNNETGKYELNREIYQKYFPVDPLIKNSGIPNLFKERSFNATKSDNDFRIFCLGGSTTEGDLSSNRFPDLLRQILLRAEINRSAEVINLGITTINSYQVADFVEEIINYEPDLLILYMGHNEIYGPLGVASGSRISTNYWLTRTVLYMQRFRLFQLLQNLYLKLYDIDTEEDRTGAFFRVMARSEVMPGSPLRAKALLYYTWNLERIIGQAEPDGERGVQWQTIIDSALSFEDGGQLQKAAETYLEAMNLYPDNAQQYFDIGQIYRAQGHYDLALDALTKARDLDIIPFRAPSGINLIIKQMVGSSDAILLDVEETFRAKSQDGLIGKPIMVEHLHPSGYGHYLIAAELAKTIFAKGLLKPAKRFDFEDPEILSSFDVQINSEELIADDVDEWPFTINNKDYRFP
jgi:lysophospholipase L1-like esterase